MKANSGILALVCGVTLLAGCGKDFVDVPNQNELSSSNFYSKVDNFELALTAVYDGLKGIDLFGQAFYVQTLVSLPHEADYWNAQCRNEVQSNDGNVEIAWRGFYRVVARANDILENAPVFLANNTPTDAQLTELNQIVAQAQFLRGYAYFHLVRLWGEESFAADSSRLAVPVILKVASTKAELNTGRATVGAVYNQIVKDFEAAEAGLPETWDANNIARVNKYAVKGFLGQVYLYEENYTKARDYFEQVLANGAYKLVPSDRYDDLFQGKDEFSEESLWELNYTIDMQQNMWENGLGSGIALVLAPPARGWSNCTPHAVGIFRFGSDPRKKICFYAPTDSAADVNGVMLPVGKSEFNYTGHSFRKYVPKDYCVYQTNRNSGINYHMLRMADVYLMYAEVMNNLGENTIASGYMNRVRRRAYGHDENAVTPGVDYDGLSGSVLRDSIREERFRELYAEGHRWYDMVRWKIVEQEVSKYNVLKVTQGEIIYNDKDYYYPVPLVEVDNNKAMFPSTGY